MAERKSKTWFTSDIHFGHANILDYCNRPFTNVDEMNEALVHNFNTVVAPEDNVYILGDICMGRLKETHKFVLRLNGNLNWIIGNHDPGLLKFQEVRDRFQSIEKIQEIKVELESGERVRATLCHYPMLSWNQSHRGSVMLHGHIHSDDCLRTAKMLNELREFQIQDGRVLIEGSAKDNATPPLKIFDVGVDANEYSPVSLDTLLEKHKHAFS